MSRLNFFCELNVLGKFYKMEFEKYAPCVDLTVDLINLPFLCVFTSDEKNWTLRMLQRGATYMHTDDGGLEKGLLIIDKVSGEGPGKAAPEISEYIHLTLELCRSLSQYVYQQNLVSLYGELDPEKAGILLTSTDEGVTHQLVTADDRPDLMCVPLFGEPTMMRPYMEDFIEREFGVSEDGENADHEESEITKLTALAKALAGDDKEDEETEEEVDESAEDGGWQPPAGYMEALQAAIDAMDEGAETNEEIAAVVNARMRDHEECDVAEEDENSIVHESPFTRKLALLEYIDFLSSLQHNSESQGKQRETVSYDKQAGVATFTLEVQGTGKEDRTERLEHVNRGDIMQLRREPSNPDDDRNIMVLDSAGASLGNLPSGAADVISPLLDAGEATLIDAKVAYLEKKSQRSARARKAILFVSFQVKLRAVDLDRDAGCVVCFLGGDQTNTWVQELQVLYCQMPLEHAKLIFELYNRMHNEYDSESNDISYIGLDNLAEEVTAARTAMRAAMKSGLDYSSGTEEEYDSFGEYALAILHKEGGRYDAIKPYLQRGADLKEISESDCIEQENYYWLDQTRRTKEQYDEGQDFGYYHWYDVAELFAGGRLPIDMTDEDVVSIFGTGEFVAFADLSYGC